MRTLDLHARALIRRCVWLALFSPLACFSATAFAGPGSPCMFPHKKNTLQYVGVGPTSLDSLDPALAYTQASWALLDNTCAKLFRYPDTNSSSNTIPIAEVANLSPGEAAALATQTTLIIPIKTGFRFSDGTPVTAASFIRAIQRARALDLGGPGLEIITSMSVNPQGALVIGLSQPVPDIVNRLAIMFACAIPESTPDAGQGLTPIPMAGRYYIDSITGTDGPYQGGLSFSSAILKRNTHYKQKRDARPANPAEIRFNYTAGIDSSNESQAVYADFLADCSDVAGVSALQQQDAKLNHPTEWFKRTEIGISYLMPNVDTLAHNGIFARCPAALKAVAYAIDRTALHNLAPDGSDVGSQISPPGIPGHDAIEPYSATADLASAQTIVSGLSVGCPSLLINILTRTAPTAIAAANLIRADLLAAGFTNVSITQVASNEFLAVLLSSAWDIALGGWIADFPDSGQIMGPLFFSGAFFNFSHFSGRDADLAFAASQVGAARTTAYHDLGLAMETGNAAGSFSGTPAFPIITYAYPASVFLVSDRVQCSAPNQIIYNPITRVNFGALCTK
jgi:ABC-type transport system substrate-binding protein